MSSAEEARVGPVYTSGWRDTVKDLVAGAAGGVAQVVIGKSYTCDYYIGEMCAVLTGSKDNHLVSAIAFKVNEHHLAPP